MSTAPQSPVTGFILALIASILWALFFFTVIEVPNVIRNHMALFLAFLCFFAAFSFLFIFKRQPGSEHIEIFRKWEASHPWARFLGLIAGVIMSAFWLGSLGIALASTPSNAMMADLIAPPIILFVEYVCYPPKKRFWLKIFYSAMALVLCLVSAFIFLKLVEASQDQSWNFLPEIWLFIPTIPGIIALVLLIIAEKYKPDYGGDENTSLETTKNLFRIHEYLGIAVCVGVVAITGRTDWVLSILTLNHVALNSINTAASFGTVVILLLLGLVLGWLVVFSVVFYDRARRHLDTSGAAMLETMDPYVSAAIGLLLFLLFYYPEHWIELGISLNGLFDSSNYNSIISIVYWLLGAALLFLATYLLSLGKGKDEV